MLHCLWLLAPLVVFPSSSSAQSVKTSLGTIHGVIDRSNPSVRQFLGIPYAKPPIGDLRWDRPHPVEEFGDIQAKKLPPSCPQYLGVSRGNFYSQEVLEFNLQGLNKTGSISEDCLTLSVWTPLGARRGDNLPILIYIYGGGFSTGGQDVPYQIPTQWVQRTKSHIVVSFNYRVNMFGFPRSAGVESQNLGLLDQRMAIEWVRDNIYHFGGDKTRMSLWGQSAGAMSVAYYTYAYPENPIVSSLILDSASEFTNLGSGESDTDHSNFTFVAENLGCQRDSPAEELACMRQVPFQDIEDFIQEYTEQGTTPSLAFKPVPDGRLVFSNYTERSLLGAQGKIPAIVGTAAQDGYPFGYTGNGVDTTVAEQVTLSLFLCPAYKTSSNRLAAGLDTWRYEYRGNFSNVSPVPYIGAYHSSELPMIFGTHGLFRGPSTKLEKATSAAMQDAYLTFTATRGSRKAMLKHGWHVYEKSRKNPLRIFGERVADKDGNINEQELECKRLYS
ncbi:Alpha/Beta hydrolase protein [Ilyonectria robusta]|uniref:Alpha/Beta hydrolase protein n=1 Tax=Ilyonectria robusta TaxID=1079257 RepID=UPI001E8DCD8B|nr:Alpha/Beta hydrolase protein [Ilyonectria robusta]KAH8663828.1 Alpha/Beta hydrolase protein [Ilyonectria robusta]